MDNPFGGELKVYTPVKPFSWADWVVAQRSDGVGLPVQSPPGPGGR